MFTDEYSDIVIEHFMCPRNAGVIKNFNGEGSNGDPKCGDSLNIYIRVENNLIEDISFLVYGCPASIATSSMTTVLAKGKTLDEALKITEDDIINALGGLPENKKHCSNLGVKALRNAINNYIQKSGKQ
ncbi:iron-sulfur cluster assembly scaffold protein [Clostridium sp. SYSU_GA19001]|uniref:iron-sulfur cluster assembly scaffold protein n=1 Tax=Clostridium caldaquaticum TaxID=2940653 RepID=UPI0020777AA8|nr:iron-sulfur cluster assembly scaffold protein [Clostridium caldaquaticum]MCM8710110.1 iron-sulfur cluster assembly scaffold protein [Clostridium caldaquaticum]